MRASELSHAHQRKFFGEVVDRGAQTGAETPATKAEKEIQENIFALQCRAHRLPMFKREYRFAEHIGRGWRFDFCWPEFQVAVELDCIVVKRVAGELRVTGRHMHPTGLRRDMEKYNAAAKLGWHLIRAEQTMIANGAAISDTIDLLKAKGWKP